MPAIIRLGDPGSHGGGMTTASSNAVFANGPQVCVDQDTYGCPIHGPQPVTATGDAMSAGKKVVVQGDSAACGATITAGSPNVNVGTG